MIMYCEQLHPDSQGLTCRLKNLKNIVRGEV